MNRGTAERALAALCVTSLAVLVALEWVNLWSTRTAGVLGDLAIYRGAMEYQAAGHSLYDYVYVHPTVHGLGFTYPPFAAIALRPLTWSDYSVISIVWVLVTMALALAMVWLVVRDSIDRGVTWLGEAPSPARAVAAFCGTATLVFASLPFLHHFVVGQVSLLIVVLCLIDVAGVVPPRFRGVLVGVAAAIKLTPLIFLPYYLVTKQWRTAARALAAFVAATGLAFVVYPQDSVLYWTQKVFQTSRVGALDESINKSLLGTLSRLGLSGTAAVLGWAVLALGVAVFALAHARRHTLGGRAVPAALIVGCLGTLVSPISWPHHQLWGVLAGAWLVLQREFRAVLLGATTLLAFLFYRFFLIDDLTLDVWVRLGEEVPVAVVVLICVIPVGNLRRDGAPAAFMSAVPGLGAVTPLSPQPE